MILFLFIKFVGIIVRNTLVMYDREHDKIGFWKTNCSELWERLHIAGAPPPMPSTSDSTNSTAPAPAGPPQHDFPGIISCAFQKTLV